VTDAQIKQSIERVTAFLTDHPEKALSTDTAAVAVMEVGLRCRAEGPNGAQLISDMPQAVGGGEAAPSPGWFLRAALANCDATVIAMRAAQLGITLTRLEVTVDGESDDRGMFDLDADVPPGPLNLRVQIRIAAAEAEPDELRQLVAWAEEHSPVGDALRRAIPCHTEVVVG